MANGFTSSSSTLDATNEAAAWFALKSSGTLTDIETARFTAWL